MEGKILIIGGYGAVGSTIAENLAAHYPGQIIVAGRSFTKAKILCDKVRGNLIPYKLDSTQPIDTELLKEIELVIMCIDQVDTAWVEYCLAKGIHYIDITADKDFIEKIESLKKKELPYRSSVILSVGLAPGITNLLAQNIIQILPETKEINIFILLGMGEKHGDSAYKWTFDNLHKKYPILYNGKKHLLKSFSAPKKTMLNGKRTFYLFDFSDQHTLLHTTKVKQIITRMAFDSRFFTKMIYMLAKTGITRIFRSRKIQKLLIHSFKKITIGSDVFGVKVTGINKEYQMLSCSVTGNGEGKITAYAATEIALLCLKDTFPKGIHHSHEVIENIPVFLAGLKKYDASLKIKL